MVAAAAIAVAALGYLTFTSGMVAPGLGTASIGGPFQLTTQDGKVFDSASLAGKPFAVFFGFTHCPEVCPTTLSDISRTFDQLGSPAKDIAVLFITIDPERDTPAVMKDYVSNFTAPIIGLTGTPDQIAAVAREYRVYYKKVPTSDGSYTMDHTAVVYLMDRKGQFQDVISYTEDQERYAAKFKKLAAE
jgi:protein SCO1/2